MDMRFHRRRAQNISLICLLSACVVLLMTLFISIASWKLLVMSWEPLTVEVKSPRTKHAVNFIAEKSAKEEVKMIKKKDPSRKPVVIASKGYTVPGCSCVRFGLDVESIKEAIEDAKNRSQLYHADFLKKYNFEGHSTCSDFATQRGAGQNVVAYSYYHTEEKVDLDSQHFKKYLGQLHGRARVVRDSYPDWTMRIYHNITEDDDIGNKFLCHIFCSYQHVDICHVHNLPGLGNLVRRDIVGRLWRFSVMGDPTVSLFLSRDSDSWILDREVAVVREWLSSDKGFHVLRDHPNHKAVMLAGLWGGSNKNLKLMKTLRDEMFSLPLNLTVKFDQYLLATRVWPHIKNDVIQFDSYNCKQKGHENSLPFPVQRIDGLYCGWGPFKFRERKKIFETNCPLECRPEDHKGWLYC